MATQTVPGQETTYKFTVAQFEQMISEGIFGEDDNVELVDGEVVIMSPINHPHAVVVSKLGLILSELVGRTAYVWAQQPLWLEERSRPQPDIALLKWREDFYTGKRPTGEDTLLVIEVADTSLVADRGAKRTKYAKAAIPEYWIVNLRNKVVEVYSGLAGGKYGAERIAGRGESLQLPGGLRGSVYVDELLVEL
ncbi:MAG: Uma2 family endonuclease [Chloroflexia bacterium]